MSKSFVLTHRHKPELTHTLGVDARFLEILESTYIDVSKLSQEDFETFLGILAVLDLDGDFIRMPLCKYVLRYV